MEDHEKNYIVGPPVPEDIPSVTEMFLATVRRNANDLAVVSLGQDNALYGFKSLPLPRATDASIVERTDEAQREDSDRVESRGSSKDGELSVPSSPSADGEALPDDWVSVRDEDVASEDSRTVISFDRSSCDDQQTQPTPWLRWTYGTLFSAVDLFGAALENQNHHRRKIGPGTPVITFLPNVIEAWMCQWTSHLNDYTWAPFNPSNLRNRPEISYMLKTVLDFAASETSTRVESSEVLDGVAGIIDGHGNTSENAERGLNVVVVVGDSVMASEIDALGLLDKTALKIIAGTNDEVSASAVECGWVSLGGMLDAERNRRTFDSSSQAQPGPESAVEELSALSSKKYPYSSKKLVKGGDRIIYFTSGSTSLPKGCVWQNPGSRLMLLRGMKLYQSRSDSTAVDPSTPGNMDVAPKTRSIYLPLPNNHSAAYACSLPFVANGGTVVIPGGRRASSGMSTPISHSDRAMTTRPFDPETTLENIALEKCTNMLLVPTMIQALSTANQVLKIDLSDLTAMLAGAPATVVHLASCFEELQVAKVVNCWGMTECIHETYTFISRQEYFDKDEKARYLYGVNLTIGAVAYGQTLKICEPESVEPGRRGHSGELHISSPSLITSYLGARASNDDLYTDDTGLSWFNTGDESILDEQGQVFITGRSKEVIVRGGENISPVAIETALLRNVRFSQLDIVVVGVPDAIAGEVPFAVVGQQEGVSKNTSALICQAILEAMGTMYLPAGTLSLGQLGLQDWPRTTIGKMQRKKIAAAVTAFLARQDSSNADEVAAPSLDDKALQQCVKDAWSSIIGIAEDKLPLDDPIQMFSDSITLMRVRSIILRQTGLALTLAAMAEAGTIAKQIDALVTSRSKTSLTQSSISALLGTGDKPAPISMVTEDQKLSITRALEENNLRWDDCTQVIVPADCNEILSRSPAYNGWSPSVVMVVPGSTDVAHLESCMKLLFDAHPLLLSMFARTGPQDAFHVLLRNEDRVADMFLRGGGPKLKSIADLLAVPRAYSALQGPASIPGPATCAEMFEIEEPKGTAVVLSMSHAVVDATFMQMILEDFDDILDGRKASGVYVGYDKWTQVFHDRRASSEAEAVVNWQVNHLRDLLRYQDSIWPLPRPLPPGQHMQHYEHTYRHPQLALFRAIHPRIASSTIYRTAMALAAAAMRGMEQVIYSSCESSRKSMPFAPRADRDLPGTEAADVAGPTMSIMFQKCSIKRDMRIIDMLNDSQALQEELTQNVTVPWRDVYDRFQTEDNLSAEDLSDSLHKMIFSLGFNWIPGMTDTETQMQTTEGQSGSFRRLRMLEPYFSDIGGLEVACGLTGQGQDFAVLQLTGTGLEVDEMRMLAWKMEIAARLMCQERNRNMTVGDVLEILGVTSCSSPVESRPLNFGQALQPTKV